MVFAAYIKLVILFGSQVTGKAGEKSDTDVAVLADHPLTLTENYEKFYHAAQECIPAYREYAKTIYEYIKR